MDIDTCHRDYSYLINKKAIELIYRQMLFTAIFFISAVFFSYAIFTSNTNTVLFFEISISLYYLPPLILCIYLVIYSYYRIYFVVSKRLVKEILLDSSIELKLFNNGSVKLDCFEIVLDQEKINYKNRGGLGDKVFNKYDYKYIGIKSNEIIYLLPYKEESKDFTIKLLKGVIKSE